jgi:polysaccharide biosynthesis transport protein
MEEKETNIYDYLGVVIRYKWTIIISLLIVLISTIYYSLTQPAEYESIATFIIESSDVVFPGAQNMKMKETARPFDFYKAIVSSRSFQNRATSALVDSSSKLPYQKLTQAEAYLLIKNLDIANMEYSDFVELKAKANTPQNAFLTATIATNFLKLRSQELDREESQNVVSFVDHQQDIALAELENIERELQKLLKSSDVSLMKEDEGGYAKQLWTLDEQLTAIQTEKELAKANVQAYENRLSQVESQLSLQLNNNNKEDAAIINLRKDLADLVEQKNEILSQHNANNPELSRIDLKIDQMKKDLVKKLLDSQTTSNMPVSDNKPVLQDLQERKIAEELNVFILENREKYYQKMIDDFNRKHPNLLEHSIEVARLTRSRTVQQNLYGFLLEKGEEAKIKGATNTGGIRVMDPPNMPTMPIPSRTKSNVILAFIVGLGLGVGIAFLRAYMDNTIRTTDDITHFLEIPLIGMVPSLEATNGNYHKKQNSIPTIPLLNGNSNGYHDILISKLKSKDPIKEIYRSLRTNIQFSMVDQSPKALVITSAAAGEGKTLTTANLAISYAEMGLRTVIVDADLRKPRQHKIFNVNRTPGLTDGLIENLPFTDIIYNTEITDLYIVPAGKSAPNPAAIIGSQKFKEFYKILLQNYDMVIFDSPPVVPVTDSMLLGAQVGQIILIVKFGATDRQLAVDALKNLKKAKVNVIGAVLNNTRFTRGDGYYHYYYHQYYSYSDNGGTGKERGEKRVESKA